MARWPDLAARSHWRLKRLTIDSQSGGRVNDDQVVGFFDDAGSCHEHDVVTTFNMSMLAAPFADLIDEG